MFLFLEYETFLNMNIKIVCRDANQLLFCLNLAQKMNPNPLSQEGNHNLL